jgi:hypothetical protein
MHVRWQTRYDDTEFRRLLADNWTSAALYYKVREESVSDNPTEAEWDLMREWFRALRVSTPEPMRTGVHLLRERAGCMGENVYVVDGQIQTTLQRFHRACETDNLVYRVDGHVWCAKCLVPVDGADIVADVARP